MIIVVVVHPLISLPIRSSSFAIIIICNHHKLSSYVYITLQTHSHTHFFFHRSRCPYRFLCCSLLNYPDTALHTQANRYGRALPLAAPIISFMCLAIFARSYFRYCCCSPSMLLMLLASSTFGRIKSEDKDNENENVDPFVLHTVN